MSDELSELREWKERANKALAEPHEAHQQYGRIGESVGDTLRRLGRELAEAKAVLRVVEWFGETPVSSAFCPCCGHMKRDGHAPDCRLAKVLAG